MPVSKSCSGPLPRVISHPRLLVPCQVEATWHLPNFARGVATPSLRGDREGGHRKLLAQCRKLFSASCSKQGVNTASLSHGAECGPYTEEEGQARMGKQAGWEKDRERAQQGAWEGGAPWGRRRPAEAALLNARQSLHSNKPRCAWMGCSVRRC